ncbi:hypothetical protein C4J81_15345 [Deltaproteobacteria bacterium Smac51]|nr:hypothetical protein C4J81_10080 [Deltaproteobacteria bacterium Smac51]UQZ90506.1 hypothetical protein C4J81_15345 [Deltaproteobacteria bacterium Smac51]
MRANLIIKAKDLASSALGRVSARLRGLGQPVRNAREGLSSLGRALRLNSREADNNTSRLRLVFTGVRQLGGGVLGLTTGLAGLAASAAMAGAALSLRLGRHVVSRVAANFKELGARIKEIGAALKGFKDAAVQTSAKVMATTAGLAYGFKRLFVDVAAQSEECGRQLSNALGSKTLGAEALLSVRRFSSDTGRELGDVTAAFAALADSGIKPTGTHLNALADMAAKKSKTLQETSEAFKRALKGEAGALAEWGVKSEARGKHMLYQYTDQAGQLVKLAAKTNDPKALSALLERVARDKAAGAEKERGQTFGGNLSKLTAKWAEFRSMIMDSGPFQFLKDELAGIVAWVEKLEKSGGLKTLAKEWGGKLTGALKAVKGGLKEGWEWLNKWGPKGLELVNTFGGVKTVAMGLALVLGGPLIGAFGGVIKNVGLLSKALALTPVGLLITAGAGLAALMHDAGALAPFLDGLREGFGGLREAVGPALTGLFEALSSAFNSAGDSMRDANGNINPEAWKELGKAIAEFSNGSLAKLIEMLARAVELTEKTGKGLGLIAGRIMGGDVERQEEIGEEQDLVLRRYQTEAKKATPDKAKLAELQKQMSDLELERRKVADGGKRAAIGTASAPFGGLGIVANLFAKRRMENHDEVFSKKAPATPFVVSNTNPAINKPALNAAAYPAVADTVNELKAAMRQKEHVAVTVKLEGQLPPGFSAQAKTDAPNAKVDDRTQQRMGFRGGLL